jgi:hypothetical protein
MTVSPLLHLLTPPQLRDALIDAFEKLTFVRESIENIPAPYVPFPRLQEISFLEGRVADYHLELARRRNIDTPVRIFYSYSRRDDSFLVELNEHLLKRKRDAPIEIFWYRDLSPGAERHPKTVNGLREADVVLLMVSPDFLVSRYCQHVELPISLTLHNCGLAVVIPVIIRECSWQETALARLQAISAGAPMCESKDREAAWAEAAESIFRMINLIRTGQRSTSLKTT